MPEEYFDEEVNEETIGQGGGFTVVEPGLYFGQIVQVVSDDEKFYCEFRILSGTKPEMVDEIHREYFHWNSKKGNRSRRAALCLGTGIYTAEQVAAARKESKGVSWEVDDLLGKVCCFKIAHEEHSQGQYAGQMRAKIPYSDIWHPGSNQARDNKIPIDRSKIADLDADPFDNPDDIGSTAPENEDEGDEFSLF